MRCWPSIVIALQSTTPERAGQLRAWPYAVSMCGDLFHMGCMK